MPSTRRSPGARPEALFQRSVERGHLSSILLWGPPGTGKTSLARLLANAIGAHFTSMSAVMSGVVDVGRDVRRIALLGGSLITLLLVLWVIAQAIGASPV